MEELTQQYRRTKAELAAADMHIENLESRVSELGIEAEKGAISQEQLEMLRETLQTTKQQNREVSIMRMRMQILAVAKLAVAIAIAIAIAVAVVEQQ
jgi:hypothetical protein